jgi:hypothetical protein
MKLTFCAVCGTTTDLQQHHIEPVVITGINRKRKKKYDENKPLKECTSLEVFAFLFDQGIISDDGELTVCSYHHNLLHGIVKFQKADHIKLVKEGQERARANGVILGRPSKINPEMYIAVKELRESDIGIKVIAKKLGIGVGTVYNIMEKVDQGIIEELKRNKEIEENPATFIDLI